MSNQNMFKQIICLGYKFICHIDNNNDKSLCYFTDTQKFPNSTCIKICMKIWSTSEYE